MHVLRVDDSNGGGDAHILIHQRRLEHSNTDILAEVAQDGGTGVVQHHTRHMKHTADHIDGMAGTVEMFIQLDHLPIGVQHLDVPPGVDVDLLNAGPEDILGQKAKFRHFCVEGIHQSICGISFDRNTLVLHILGDIPLDLAFRILVPTIGDQGGVFAGDILLHFLENTVEVPAVALRCKEKCMSTVGHHSIAGQRSAGRVIGILHICVR